MVEINVIWPQEKLFFLHTFYNWHRLYLHPIGLPLAVLKVHQQQIVHSLVSELTRLSVEELVGYLLSFFAVVIAHHHSNSRFLPDEVLAFALVDHFEVWFELLGFCLANELYIFEVLIEHRVEFINFRKLGLFQEFLDSLKLINVLVDL